MFICSRVHNSKKQKDFYQCLPNEGPLTKYTVPGYNVISVLGVQDLDLMFLSMTQRLDINSYLRVNVKVFKLVKHYLESEIRIIQLARHFSVCSKHYTFPFCSIFQNLASL